MKRILVVSDSFKGTLSSKTIGRLFDTEAKKIAKDVEVLSRPLADGGEGTVEAFASYWGGTIMSALVTGPFGERKPAIYLLHGKTAVLEVASVIGLPDAAEKNPAKASTYGVGELILHAKAHGAKTIYLGLGGSCSNDGGTGMASALGVRFLDAQGNEFSPTGSTLLNIDRIILPESNDLKIIGLSDVKNPLYGSSGASYVYGPQKGADETMVRFLDDGLKHLAKIAEEALGKDLSKKRGAGAAGGIGFGLLAFLGGKLTSGISASLRAMDFKTLALESDLIVSGEGRLDSQSLQGKAISGVLKKATKLERPCALIVGCTALSKSEVPCPVYVTSKPNQSFEDIKAHAEEDYSSAAKRLLLDFLG